MLNKLESWLTQATRHLSKESADKIRTEIAEHYESARDEAIADGATIAEAGSLALQALGDPKIANRQYRHVLLTSDEAKMLRDGNWEARTICSRLWLKWLLLGLPVIAAAAAAAFLFTGRIVLARDLLTVGVGMCPLLSAPFLPIYTRSRGRIFRLVKWVALSSALLLLFGPEAIKWSWLIICCLWPTAWIEWTRASIRRKLPIASWPKHLYL